MKASLTVLAAAVLMSPIGVATAATVTATAGTGGKILPSGAITVKDGATQQFGVAANSGYTILSVSGCSGQLAKTSGGYIYTTVRIMASCKVIASFKLLAPRITWFKINNDAAETITRFVTLNFSTASGSMPTHYRASSRSDFAGVLWTSLGGATALSFDVGPEPGPKTIYLQLWDYSSGGSGYSNVMSDTINLQARQVYTIPARDFYAAAESRGFRSSVLRNIAPCSCQIIQGPADGVPSSGFAAQVLGDYCAPPSSGYACEFTFFEGSILQNSFVLGPVLGRDGTVECMGTFDVGSLPPGSTSARFTLKSDPARNCRYIFDSIVLEGPANSDWHLALGLKP